MSETTAHLELDEVMADAPFFECHERLITAPIEVVWPAGLAVTAREVRALGPLLSLRRLPRMVLDRGRPGETGLANDTPLVDAFAESGFSLLRRDETPVDGRAVALLGAAGRFWSPAHNLPVTFDRPQDFLDFDEPGYAKTVVSLEAVSRGQGKTQLVTVTRVIGTDRAAALKFAGYWALIRMPSGLIRRGWLAAIERRATAGAAD